MFMLHANVDAWWLLHMCRSSYLLQQLAAAVVVTVAVTAAAVSSSSSITHALYTKFGIFNYCYFMIALPLLCSVNDYTCSKAAWL